MLLGEMNLKKRREFLKLCVASLPALVYGHGADADDMAGRATAQSIYRKPGSLERYIDPLPVPKRLMPQSTSEDGVRYRVRMLEFTQQLHSQLPPTRLWGYEGQYPGPTIEAQRGVPTIVQWENQLPSQHIFDIDPSISGARPPTPAVRIVPHVHGSRSPSDSDGLPDRWFTPGQSARYRYPNSQRAATLWYHDQAVGITRLNVYAGLSGFFLLCDDEERSMDLPSGDYEIPLMLQDRTLDDYGQLVYSPTFDDGQKAPPHFWGPSFFGNVPVVNGAIYPYKQVEPRRYRVRLLNGANSRFFNLFFNLAKRPTDIPSLVAFHQIGTDDGFLSGPVALNKLLLAPGERADLIIDFSGLEGKIVTLSNDAPAPFPGWEMIDPHHSTLNELMLRTVRGDGCTRTFAWRTNQWQETRRSSYGSCEIGIHREMAICQHDRLCTSDAFALGPISDSASPGIQLRGFSQRHPDARGDATHPSRKRGWMEGHGSSQPARGAHDHRAIRWLRGPLRFPFQPVGASR
jgi:spore coat protein A